VLWSAQSCRFYGSGILGAPSSALSLFPYPATFLWGPWRKPGQGKTPGSGLPDVKKAIVKRGELLSPEACKSRLLGLL
jgi:hypothetical protein